MVILYNNNTIAEEKEEMENWIANDVFDSVDKEGQRCMLVNNK